MGKKEQVILCKILLTVLGLLVSLLLLSTIDSLWLNPFNINYKNYFLLIPLIESLIVIMLLLVITFNRNIQSRLFKD